MNKQRRDGVKPTDMPRISTPLPVSGRSKSMSPKTKPVPGMGKKA